MSKTMHLELPVELGQQVLEKRFRREGRITVLVTLVGIVIAACCAPISNVVGSVFNAGIHPAFICALGIVVALWGIVMIGVHSLRSPEDILDEHEGTWGRRGWYTGGGK